MAPKEKFNFNEAFISEYEKEENLWNIRSTKYKDRNAKKTSLDLLGENLNYHNNIFQHLQLHSI